MVDWYERISDWIDGLIGGEGGEAPGFQIIGKAVLPSGGRGGAGGGGPQVVSLVPPVKIVPAEKHTVTFHRDWGISKREGSWSEVRALWRVFANRGTTSPYDRPTIYKEPSGGAGWIDGQRVRYRDPFKGSELVKKLVQDRPSIGYPPIVMIQGYQIRSSRIFWRDRDSWLHWKSRIYMSTARFIDTLPRIPIGGEVRVEANLHFGVHKRAIQNKALKLAEEAAAKIGQIYPYSAWAVAAFGDADPTWWRASDVKGLPEFEALRRA